jgi:hypothetical protein
MCSPMFVIFHVNVIICQNFKLPHVLIEFLMKKPFLDMKNFNYSHGSQTWFKLCGITWFDMFQLS